MRKKPNFYYVYIITNLINNIQYVGSKVCYEDDPLNDGYFGSSLFLNKDIKELGKENFKKKILKLCDSKKEMRKDEISYILEYNTLAPNGYNRHLPPEKFNTTGISIYKIWELKFGKEEADRKYKEWREKESKSQSGEKNSFFGKSHSEKTKEQIRQKQTGKTYSTEVNKKKGNPKFGKQNGMFEKVWITNNNKNKIISKQELNNYLNNGWTKGRKIQRI